MSRGAKLYLQDIEQSINKIERYTRNKSFASFSRDEKTVDAVVRNLGIIGEAAVKIPGDIRKKHPDVAWKEISGMRQKIIHDYFGVDVEILWKTIKDDLPLLKKQIAVILGKR